MSDRYTKLFSLPENLYEKGCPVMICAGALSKDNQTDKVLVQLRFQNIDSRYRTIVAVKVALQPFGIAHNPLGSIKEYQYLDINTERGAEAGSKQPVYLDNNTARSFSASVLEVVFEDSSVWTGNAQNWSSLQQTKLSDKFSDDLMKQYQRDTFAEAKYEPFTKDGIWMCACGALNVIEDSKCCRCRNEKVKQLTALDHNVLVTNHKAYTASKQTEQKKMAEEISKKSKKTAIICGIIALIICCCLAIFLKPSVPEVVGTWESKKDSSITFVLYKNKTGDLTVDGESVNISWKYDETSHELVLTRPGTDFEENMWYRPDEDALLWTDGVPFGRVLTFDRVTE